MEEVLVSGIYQGAKHLAGFKCGIVQLDWAYNATPHPQADLPGCASEGGEGVLIREW
jgi:hypothetical protein